MKPTTEHTKGEGNIDPTKIIIPERMRRDDPETRDYINNELAPSISTHGIIQPIVVSLDDEGNATLVAGWCRLQASLVLRLKSIPYNTRVNLPQDVLMALEWEENGRRRNMRWQDNIMGIYTTHRLKVTTAAKDYKSWGQAQTGKVLGVSLGYVNDAIKLAEAILEDFKPVSEAPNVSAAIQALYKRAQDKVDAELAKRHAMAPVISAASKQTKPRIKQAESGMMADLSGTNPPSLPPLTPSGSESVTRQERRQIEGRQVALSTMLFHMDNRDWFDQAEPESVDLIYTDPPYATNMANFEDRADIERVAEEHDVEENLDQMPGFYKNCYKVLKENGYALIFFDLKHYLYNVECAEKAGFKVQPFPLLALKTTTKNQAFAYHWPKTVEYVLVCRKGNAVLKAPQPVNYFVCDWAPERKLQRNPFSKPFAFSQWCLAPILKPGMVVLDAYAGEGSITRAIINLGGVPIAIEKKKIHFDRLQEHVKKTYDELIPGGVEFV